MHAGGGWPTSHRGHFVGETRLARGRQGQVAEPVQAVLEVLAFLIIDRRRLVTQAGIIVIKLSQISRPVPFALEKNSDLVREPLSRACPVASGRPAVLHFAHQNNLAEPLRDRPGVQCLDLHADLTVIGQGGPKQSANSHKIPGLQPHRQEVKGIIGRRVLQLHSSTWRGTTMASTQTTITHHATIPRNKATENKRPRRRRW